MEDSYYDHPFGESHCLKQKLLQLVGSQVANIMVGLENYRVASLRGNNRVIAVFFFGWVITFTP